MIIINKTNLEHELGYIIENMPIYDIHTHIYPKEFTGMLLTGIDELLVYHYLLAEYFRYSKIPYDDFFVLNVSEQAELVWDELFVKRTPISEPAMGVITILKALNIDFKTRDLNLIRKQMKHLTEQPDYVAKILKIANIKQLVMTNDPFDSAEMKWWDGGEKADDIFLSSLRLDSLVNTYKSVIPTLKEWGYMVEENISGNTVTILEKFLTDCINKFEPGYVAVSLAPDFGFTEKYSTQVAIIEEVILPICRKYNKPLAIMTGAIRQVNPALRLAGDWMGQTDLYAIERLVKDNPDNKFLITAISRENQHQLVVLARKFRNIHIFGCWWQVNIPETIVEITNMRIELLGLSTTLQHSDARVLEQLIYKWSHFKELLKPILQKKYLLLLDAGWQLSDEDLKKDVNLIFGGAFIEFIR